MWGTVAILFVSICYSSAEQFELNIVALPHSVPTTTPPPVVNATDRGDSRIIGGVPARIEVYPYAVQVLRNNWLECGGSLITRRHVLSAAHCFLDDQGVQYSPRLFTCRYGTAALYSGGSTRKVSMIINHEWYNYGYARDNDISVLLLASSVTLSARVGLASIPQQDDSVPDKALVYVIGWGSINATGYYVPLKLHEVSVFTIDQNTCGQRYRYLELIGSNLYPVTSNMMCSGVLDIGGRDACTADYGGPVVYEGVVVGVSSWGVCGHPTYPGVNARVAAYSNWIHTTVFRFNGAPRSLDQPSVVLLLAFFLISAVFKQTL